jgi:hypothetical protein
MAVMWPLRVTSTIDTPSSKLALPTYLFLHSTNLICSLYRIRIQADADPLHQSLVPFPARLKMFHSHEDLVPLGTSILAHQPTFVLFSETVRSAGSARVKTPAELTCAVDKGPPTKKIKSSYNSTFYTIPSVIRGSHHIQEGHQVSNNPQIDMVVLCMHDM